MPPDGQLQKAAVAAAGKLQDLLKGAGLSQLLQRPPPVHPTAQQQQLLGECFIALQQLHQALAAAAASAAAGQQLSSVLRLDSAYNTAALIVWGLERPAQLQVQDVQGSAGSLDPLTGVWFFAHASLMAQLAMLNTLDPGTAAQLAMGITQQLERSGEQAQASTMITARCRIACYS